MHKHGRKPLIMIVDDTPFNIVILEEILHGQGYQVAAFPKGESALIAAAEDPTDLILLDILMPEMDGFGGCLSCFKVWTPIQGRHVTQRKRKDDQGRLGTTL